MESAIPASNLSDSSHFVLRRKLKRFAQLGTGHFIYGATGWFLDHVVYVAAIYHLGLLRGGLLMGSLATLYCAIILLLYQKMGIDWVGAGSLDKLLQNGGRSWWQRGVRWALCHGNWAVFGALSILQDAFITTAYFRRGRFGDLAPTDWKIFFGSAILGNIYWTLRSGVVAAIIVKSLEEIWS